MTADVELLPLPKHSGKATNPPSHRRMTMREDLIEWKEGDLPDLDIERPIPEHHQQWFETLTKAFKKGDVALMTCGSPSGVRTVICMVNHHQDGSAEFIPVGEMCEVSNPFEHYIPPF